MGSSTPSPTGKHADDVVRRGPAHEDELYLDEILALTPIKRTRLYTFRDRGRFGPVREAPGPTCPRPVFLLEGVATVCEELGYPAPTVDQILSLRASGTAASADEGANATATAVEQAGPEIVSEPPVSGTGAETTRNRAQRRMGFDLDLRSGVTSPAGIPDGAPPRGEEPDRRAIDEALQSERVRQLEGEHEVLRAERDRARSEEAAGRERSISLEADLRIIEAARERALEDLSARDGRIRRLESDLEERTAETHRLNAEHRGVQGELRQAVAERDAARGDRKDLREERDALREEASEAREENAALRPEIELLRANTTRGFRRRQRRQARREGIGSLVSNNKENAEEPTADGSD